MNYVLMIKMIISSFLGKLSKCLDVFDNILDSKKNSNAQYVGGLSCVIYTNHEESEIELINPSNGNPMVGNSGIDVCGNTYGTSGF